MIPLNNQITSFLPSHFIGKFLVSHNLFLRVLRKTLIFFLLLLSLFRLYIGAIYPLGNNIYKKDFLSTYVLTRAINEGINPYSEMSILISRYIGISSNIFPHPTPYPPTVGIIFLPLSLFRYETALIIWFIIEFLCFFSSLVLLFFSTTKPIPWSWISIFVILAFLYWPVIDELKLANINMVLLLIICGMRFAYYKKQKITTGVLFGLSMLIKQIFWPVILIFVMRKEWRVTISAIITTIFGYFISGLVVGFDKLWLNFFEILPSVSKYYSMTPWNISLLSLVTRIFRGLGGSPNQPVEISFLNSPPLINHPQLIIPIWLGLVIIIIMTTYNSLRSIQNIDMLLGIMLCISIIVSPMSWAYSLVFMLIPATYIITRLWQENFPVWKTNIALLIAGFQLISLTKWIDLGIRAAGNSKGLIYEPGANIVPFWAGLFGIMVLIGVILQIIYLFYLDRNPTKNLVKE